jgi:threonine dehydratase
VQTAHQRIKPYIHHTPLATCQTLNRIASTPIAERPQEFHPAIPSAASAAEAGKSPRREPSIEESTANPQINIFFKCENLQRIGAFKVRGAFHALGRLIEVEGMETVRKKGVVAHSSGKDS